MGVTQPARGLAALQPAVYELCGLGGCTQTETAQAPAWPPTSSGQHRIRLCWIVHKETGTRFAADLLRCPGSTPRFVGVQMCWRTPLS